MTGGLEHPPPPLNGPRVCGPQREWARLGLIYPRGAVTRAQLALCPPRPPHDPPLVTVPAFGSDGAD